MSQALLLLTLGLLTFGPSAGCATYTTAEGVTYHFIIGFGLVRTKAAENAGVVATDARSLGVVVSNRPGLKLGVGYASSTVVSVPPGARDVRVEVSRRPFGPFIVDAPSVEVEAEHRGSSEDEP
jgi:hypothetical protein